MTVTEEQQQRIETWTTILDRLGENRLDVIRAILSRDGRTLERVDLPGAVEIKIGTRVVVNDEKDVWVTIGKTISVEHAHEIDSAYTALTLELHEMMDEQVALLCATGLAEAIYRKRHHKDVVALNALLKGIKA